MSSGARIRTTSAVNVRPTPAGTPPTLVAAGSEGTILDGPVAAIFGGQTLAWWQVEFDSNVVGWTPATFFTVLSSDTLITKDLQVCLPPHLNANLGTPLAEPLEVGDVIADCEARVEPAFVGQASERPAGSTCACAAVPAALPTEWAAECDAGCTDLSGVCLVAGTDPPEPTPDGLSTGLFTTTSTCDVSGEAEVHLDGNVFNTSVNGVVQIHGRPCQGEECQVGLSYQLKLGNIEIPVRFYPDPKFVDLTLSGASEPLAVDLVPFLPGSPVYVGVIPAGASLNSARGRSLSESKPLVVVGRNGADLGVSVDWVNKRCLLTGSFVGGASGGIVDDQGTVAPVQLHLTVGGLLDPLSHMVNQPPLANAGPDQILECSSPAGAAVTLTAGASTDADNNIAFHAWRLGSENGPHVVPPSPSPTVMTQQTVGETTYHLRTVDARLSADNDAVTVKVVDTMAAAIDCHAPVTIPKHDQPISFKATATDICGPAPAVVVENVECFKESPKGRIKSNPSCKASIQGDTLTIGNSAGADVIRWSARTADAAGNATTKMCEVRVD